jgi:sugar/nucleoside kinase (ribokinase family)
LTPDLVVLGNLLVDDVVFGDGRTRMEEPGGAVLYAALGAALWGVRVGVVSVRGDDYPQAPLETMAARGIDLAGARPLGAPGLRTWLLYEDRRRQVVHRLDRPSHAEVSPGPDDIPAAWREARAFHLAPMPLDVQQGLVTDLSARGSPLVSLDPYLLMRPDTMPIWRALLPSVDVFFVSEDEDELGEEPLRALAGPRTRFLLWKRGARGGRLWDAREKESVDWKARADVVEDPTGAGDAFAGGFLAGLLRGDTTKEALERGIVSASFALATHGPVGLLRATSGEAARRRHEWYAR